MVLYQLSYLGTARLSLIVRVESVNQLMDVSRGNYDWERSYGLAFPALFSSGVAAGGGRGAGVVAGVAGAGTGVGDGVVSAGKGGFSAAFSGGQSNVVFNTIICA